MRVLLGVTYYRPHVSGLTIYVERLARAMARRGHEVTILTSRFDPTLPRDETIDGVRIVRVPVAMRLSKGVIMPTQGVWATRLVRSHDVASLHLPMFDAAGIAARGRLFGTPTVLTYHCDLQLPPGAFNRVVDQVVHGANQAAARLADRIVAYTADYADHSRLLRQFPGKLVVIPPPVEMRTPTCAEVSDFRERHALGDGPLIGMAARLAAEKGVEHLVEAMPPLLERFPDLKVLFAGPHENVLGEARYREKLLPRITALGDHWEFLGTLSSEQLPAFYGSLGALLVASVNSTESFGLVQVEAMLCGTPVIATDLPGVRQPVRATGMGRIVPVADAAALVEAVTAVLSDPERYRQPRELVAQHYDMDVTVSSYERLFEEVIQARKHSVSLPSSVHRGGQGEGTGMAGDGPGRATPDYLGRHLREMAPHRALLRAVECRYMGQVPLVHPVLDVGCGDGHFASVAYSEPIDVGLDPMDRDLREAATRVPDVYLEVVKGSATAMPFPDGAFATVLSNCVIEHIPDVDATLREISRVLRPGGTFATTLPSEHFADYLLGATVARKLGMERLGRAYGDFFNRISHHEHVDPPAVWRERLAAVGLEVVEQHYYFSPAAHRVFDLAHYIGVPNLVAKRLSGRWVVHPIQAKPLERWYRRYYEESLPERGAYQFVRCVRR